MSDSETHFLVTVDGRVEYPSRQALNIDVLNQLKDDEEFSVEDADGNTVLTGTWHPLTPSRFT